MSIYSKTGQGAFKLSVSEVDGTVTADMCEGGEPQTFHNPRAAYDHYRDIFNQTSENSAWNICYHLEDHMR